MCGKLLTFSATLYDNVMEKSCLTMYFIRSYFMMFGWIRENIELKTNYKEMYDMKLKTINFIR